MRRDRMRAQVKFVGAPAHRINNPERTPIIVAAMKEGVKLVIDQRIRRGKIQVFVRIPASKKNL
jgi:hypothetical protein